MATTKAQYVTLSPVTPKGKWTVCSRRLGTRERLAPIAECRNEVIADQIVDGLNSLQGEITKLEIPAQRTLVEVRDQLAKERTRSDNFRIEVNALKQEVRLKDEELRRIKVELHAAQKQARETA